jgi:putative tryptophan/tyrosine transport system substrate-binding protein
MNRREFFAVVGSMAATWPIRARAQQPGKKWRVGQVAGGTRETAGHLTAAVEQRLRDLGYVQDRNITLLTRFAVPRPESMESAIQSLITDIDLLLVWSTVGGAAAKKLGPTMPVIFAAVGAPVDIGLVESLSHPGGNMTGITFEAASETYGRRLQLLKEIQPNLSRVAVLRAVGDPNVQFAMTALESSAPILGITLAVVDISSADELTTAFAEMQRTEAEAVLVVAGALMYSSGKKIADLALAHRLPSCHAFKDTVLAGGLISLGPDLVAIGRQAASLVDKVLRGARPAELPVQQPERYEVHVNLKTAKALGLTVPPTLLARADEVIE